MSEIKTWLSDSMVGYNRVVDHRSRQPVLSPLHLMMMSIFYKSASIIGVPLSVFLCITQPSSSS